MNGLSSVPILFLDFLGTMVYSPQLAMPMFPFMVNRLRACGYRVVVLTSCTRERARETAARVGFENDLEIHTTSDRGQTISEILQQAPATEIAYYIDDKPEGLASVLETGLACLNGRVLGFIGSRKYCKRRGAVPAIAHWCAANRVPLALSPYDILCWLHKHDLIEEYALQEPMLQSEELGLLVPGLVSPFSSFGGVARELGHLVLKQWNGPNPEFWKNAAWIGTWDCQGKLLIRLALESLGMDIGGILKEAVIVQDYVKAVNGLPWPARLRTVACINNFRRLMSLGLEEIGPAAEDCRPAGGKLAWDKARMEKLDLNVISPLNADS